jgi:DNA-binding transcriptional LysR family regulator
MLDLNEFVTFATVTETGSFSRAAERLEISKALVSRHIGDLEHSLGVKLLNRTTRKIGLTAAGAVFYERCQQLIAHADNARHELERFRVTPGGSIKVSSAISFGRLHLAPAIARFLNTYPDMSVELDLTDRFADLVTGGADVVIRSAEEPRLLSLVARKVAPLRWITCATPAYLDRHDTPRTPHDLTRHNCIVYSTNPRGEWSFDGPQGVELIRVRGNYKANNADGVLHGVLQGLGVAVVPCMAAAEYLNAGRLVRLLPEYLLPEKTLYAAYLPNPTMAQCVQTFVRFLVDQFGDHPYWEHGLEPGLTRSPVAVREPAAAL